jgi:hypothetical protein
MQSSADSPPSQRGLLPTDDRLTVTEESLANKSNKILRGSSKRITQSDVVASDMFGVEGECKKKTHL